MKQSIYLGAFLMCIRFASAQLISVSMGPSFAVGDYGSKEFTNAKGSQAGVGLNAKISNSFFPTSIVSPTAFIFFNNNSMTSGEIEALFPRLDYIPLSPYRQFGAGIGLTVQSKQKGINAGVSGNIGVADYASAGFVLNDMKSTNYVKVKPNNVAGMIYSFGGFVRIPVSERVTLNVNVEYWGGKVDYGELEYESQGMYYSSPVDVKIPVQFIAAQVGFSVNLQRYSTD